MNFYGVIIAFIILFGLVSVTLGPYLLVTQDSSNPQSYFTLGLMLVIISPVLLGFLYGYFIATDGGVDSATDRFRS